MTQTPNFHLNQWSPEDYVRRTDFNADNAKIDAALAAAGNCRIVTGSYVGTGESGQANKNSLTFEKTPLFLAVGGANNFHFWAVKGDDAASVTRGQNGPESIPMTWNGKTVSWYHSSNAERQLNVANRVYTYIALIATE